MTTSHYARTLVWYAEDACWVVEVPDLPGCFAHGATPTDAIANSEAAIAAWIDVARQAGDPVPAPSSTALRAAPQLR